MAGNSPTLHEEFFAPRNLEDVIALQRALVEHAGASDSLANGCVMWVVHRSLGARGQDDAVAPNTRVKYRKLLGQLLEHGWPDGGRRRRGKVVPITDGRQNNRGGAARRDERGRTSAAVTAVATVVMLASGAAFGPVAQEARNLAVGDQTPARAPIGAPGAPEPPRMFESGEAADRDDERAA